MTWGWARFMSAACGEPPLQETGMETPCINVCVIEPGTQVCTGCRRTLAEIARWSRLSAPERRRIMAELPTRLPPVGIPPAKTRGVS